MNLAPMQSTPWSQKDVANLANYGNLKLSGRKIQSVDDYKRLRVGRRGLLSYLSECRGFAEHSVYRLVHFEQMVYEDHFDVGHYTYFVDDGALITTWLGLDGTEIVTGWYFVGDLLGDGISTLPKGETAKVVTRRARLIAIETDWLMTACGTPLGARVLAAELHGAFKSREFYLNLKSCGYRVALKSLAYMLYKRFGTKNGRVDIHVNQDTIGMSLATSRCYISKLLSELRRARYLKWDKQGLVIYKKGLDEMV